MNLSRKKYSRRKRRRPDRLLSNKANEEGQENSDHYQDQAETRQVDTTVGRSSNDNICVTSGATPLSSGSASNFPAQSEPHSLPSTDLQRKKSSHQHSNVEVQLATVDENSSDDSSDYEDINDGQETYFSEYLDNPFFDLFEHTEQNTEVDERINYDDEDELTDGSSLRREYEGDAAIRELTRSFLLSFKRSMPRSVFLGVISLYGKCRQTYEQYEHLVAMMKDGEHPTQLPCVTTMRKTIFPRLLKTVLAKSSILELPTKPGFARYLRRTSIQSKYQTQAVVVLPSTWARLDVRSLHILRDIACVHKCRCQRHFGSTDLRVDSTRHVLERHQLSERANALWVNKSGVPIPSTVGMNVRFHTTDTSNISQLLDDNDNFMNEKVQYRGENCTAYEAEILSTHHVRHSDSNGVFIETGREPTIESDSLRTTLSRCITFLQTLCKKQHQDSSASSDSGSEHEQSRHNMPKTRRQREIRRKISDARLDNDRKYILPSDHITIVSFGRSSVVGVYVSRFWVERLDDERNFFLILNFNNDGRISYSSLSTIGAPVYINDGSSHKRESRSGSQCQTTGRLSNGMRYYMYRILLYADDFNPRSSLFPKGSVGGVYLSPSGLNVRSRRSQTSIRTVSLTPHGVSTNVVLDSIIGDLVTGSISGFDSYDAYGERVRIYLDIMGFVGDYPASSAVVDLKGHNATAPCTHCGFTFNKSTGMSTFAYSTSITSNNNAYMRTQQRTESLRSLNLSDHHHKCLGTSVIEYDDLINSNSCPLLKLASKHNESVSTEISISPYPLFKKDGYFLNVIAPDHLVSGLFKGILTVVFIQLTDNTNRDKLQMYLRKLLSDYGFQTQSVLFKQKTNKLVPGLSMSTLYCILTFVPAVLEALGELQDHPAKGMLINLHRFSSIAFWWPSLSCDGADAWSFVHGTGLTNYHRCLKVLAANFVKAVDKFSRQYPDLSHHVDRPNAHRLLELAQHTIPTYNHITYVCELVFESAHQPLKFFLSRNHSLRSHIYAVQLVLAKDWLIRVWSLWSIHTDPNESDRDKHFALMGLLRFMGSEKIDGIDWNAPSFKEYLEQLKEHVHKLMRGTVERRLDKWYSNSRMTFSSDPKWIVQNVPTGFKFSSEQESFFSITSNELSGMSLQQPGGFKLCMKAVLDRGFGSSGKSNHERLDLGDIVQILLTSGFEHNRFITSTTSDKGMPHFFVVGGLYRCKNGKSCAVVKKCTVISTSSPSQLPGTKQSPYIEVQTPNFYDTRTCTRYYYMELKRSVTKVGVIHNCKMQNQCVFSSTTKEVKHCQTTQNGGRFFITTRSMGYPPRRS